MQLTKEQYDRLKYIKNNCKSYSESGLTIYPITFYVIMVQVYNTYNFPYNKMKLIIDTKYSPGLVKQLAKLINIIDVDTDEGKQIFDILKNNDISFEVRDIIIKYISNISIDFLKRIINPLISFEMLKQILKDNFFDN